MENQLEISRSDIIIHERLRKDYGDLSDTIESIERYGTIHPMTLHRREDGKFELVAGGRRMACCDELGYTTFYYGSACVPGKPGFNWVADLTEDQRREIELEENVRRKDMSWQERVQSIAAIHALKMKLSAINREEWGLRETGQLVGFNFAYVSWMVRIAKELQKPGTKIGECTGVTDAVRFLIRQVEDESQAEVARMSAAGQSLVPTEAETPVALSNETGGIEVQSTDTKRVQVPLSRMLHKGDSTILMNAMEPESVDHIFTDWPYAIEMKNLVQGDVGRVADTHDVSANVTDYPKWMLAMHRVLRPGGFMFIWYDNMQWQYMFNIADGLGLGIQRWPVVWIKTSNCQNQSANKNFTKATEFCMVLRKGNANILKPQHVNYWSGPAIRGISNPFAKPEGLWHYIMDPVVQLGQTVLDPFMGEGSMITAAIKKALRPIGFELEATHYNQAQSNVRELYTSLTKGNVEFV